ncbi:cation-transporting P-type ATPase [Silicimonas algicola]|uniref:Ca2+-transporting ATPase n=1 Tax=Silicimonas algicola TaxID=1826607 RepID=A0A316GES8_9RHOB|nr:cation-transporting P-type ATPase [Silicimonas algicola]AZQ67732.1 cation-transporting P-type ATPase [Silicimonas algicola]PWK57860.1 Ca2+-transporting ATPase [Silicimonas algicola]
MQDALPTRGGGLDTEAVAALREQYGWNEIPRQKALSPFVVLARQFRGFLILILGLAAAIAFLLDERIDALAILVVLVLNAVLGFVQEWRAETALEALRAMLTPVAVVVRDGVERKIAAREIVPGDLVIVSAGEAIPADMRLQAGTELRTDESALTGESLPVPKTVGGEGAASRLFAGTTLVAGRATGIVTETGLQTDFGKVAALTGAVGEKQTELQKRLGQLAKEIGLASLVVAALVVAVGWYGGRPIFEMVMTGLSLTVAMVPEGLPAVVTITLALGASAMARRQALTRRLQAVETLGAASVICTDKTGTLTENAMRVTRLWTPDSAYDVTGEGYSTDGFIERDGIRVDAESDPILGALLRTALTCTNASLRRDGETWAMIGDPTEGALVAVARKGRACEVAPADRIAEVAFSSERKRMSVLAREGDGYRLHVKGAPEVVLDRSTAYLGQDGIESLDPSARQRIADAYARMAAQGLRVLALAARPADEGDVREHDLVFLGLAGMIDPPRPEVKSAIALARSAGIRVMMITGDGRLTAAAIAEQVGLGRPEVVEGGDLDALSDEQLSDLLRNDVLFARTRPEHKLRIVETLQAQGLIVAMTGDGVNDAPALKTADIGIAMGVRGTEVSRSAADLILLDDNFSTIVNAIAEGRRQFDNVRKFVRYLLCSNAGEVMAILANLFLGGPVIFLATQILWMNLITDGATAVALGLEKAEPEQMRSPPRRRGEPILGRTGMALVLCFGVYTSAASLWIFYSLLPLGTDLARTAAFTGMLVFEKVSVFAFRSLQKPVTSIGWLSNPVLIAAFTASLLLQVAAVYWPPLQTLLKTVPLSIDEWLTIGAFALPLVVVPEVVKGFTARRLDGAPA